jgi:transposase
MDLTVKQWELLAPHIPIPEKKDGRGRPRQDDQMLLNGMLWILRTGAPWKDLPGRYGNYNTCFGRFQTWVELGIFAEILTVLAQDMEERGKLNVSECFIDGTFSSAKKGGLKSAIPRSERAVKSWQLQTSLVFRFPSSWPLLIRMKSDWWKQRLPADLPERFQEYLSVTGLTTPTSLMDFYENVLGSDL